MHNRSPIISVTWLDLLLDLTHGEVTERKPTGSDCHNPSHVLMRQVCNAKMERKTNGSDGMKTQTQHHLQRGRTSYSRARGVSVKMDFYKANFSFSRLSQGFTQHATNNTYQVKFRLCHETHYKGSIVESGPIPT